MKRVLFLLVTFFSLQVFAESSSVITQENTTINVSLEKGKVSNDDTYPRSIIPIICVYENGIVQLTLLEEVGEIILTVTNHQTGERWSAINALALQTSISSGVYVVQIDTGDGSIYYGTYTL